MGKIIIGLLFTIVLFSCSSGTHNNNASAKIRIRILDEGLRMTKYILKGTLKSHNKGVNGLNEMFDVAKNLLQSYRLLDESIDNGYDTVETKATYILLDAVLNSTCTWITGMLHLNVNCSDTNSIVGMITQLSLFNTVEKALKSLRAYKVKDNVDSCRWLHCNFNSNCNPGYATEEQYIFMKSKSPKLCVSYFRIYENYPCDKVCTEY